MAARGGGGRVCRDGDDPLQHPSDEGAGHGLPEGARAAARQAAPRHMRTLVLPQVSWVEISYIYRIERDSLIVTLSEFPTQTQQLSVRTNANGDSTYCTPQIVYKVTSY